MIGPAVDHASSLTCASDGEVHANDPMLASLTQLDGVNGPAVAARAGSEPIA